MTTNLLLFAIFIGSMLLMSMNHKKKKKKIVFFGDSITEQATKGNGYIRQLKNIMQNAGVDEDYELKSEGVPGDKIHDLHVRLDADVLAKGADIVVIFIGVNDVGHKFSSLTETDFLPFETLYKSIIEKLLAAAIKVVLCTPTVIGEKTSFSSDEDLEIDLYSDAIKELALQYDLPLVDLRKAFIDYILANNFNDLKSGILTTDTIHLNNKGNQLVAEEMWQVLQQITL